MSGATAVFVRAGALCAGLVVGSCCCFGRVPSWLEAIPDGTYVARNPLPDAFEGSIVTGTLELDKVGDTCTITYVELASGEAVVVTYRSIARGR